MLFVQSIFYYQWEHVLVTEKEEKPTAIVLSDKIVFIRETRTNAKSI